MKVTKELFDKIKDGYACSGLSIRTVKNITRSKNYTEYRKKYCEKKTKETKQQNILNDYVSELTNTQVSLDILSDSVERNYTLLFKLLLINLAVTVIGFAIINALIAW